MALTVWLRAKWWACGGSAFLSLYVTVGLATSYTWAGFPRSLATDLTSPSVVVSSKALTSLFSVLSWVVSRAGSPSVRDAAAE